MTDTSEAAYPPDSVAELMAMAFESQEGRIVTDAMRRILVVTQAVTRITGYSAEDVAGKTPGLLGSGLHDAAFFAAMRERLEYPAFGGGLPAWSVGCGGLVPPAKDLADFSGCHALCFGPIGLLAVSVTDRRIQRSVLVRHRLRAVIDGDRECRFNAS